MKTLLLTILFATCFHLTYCQGELSKHSLQIFKNDSEKKVRSSEFGIIVDGNKISAKKIEDTYGFPKLDKDKTFQFVIKTNGIEFRSGTFKSWYLNNGSSIIVGKLTRIEKLLSVAEYNGMDKNNEDFDIFSKRFFIVNDVYTIDIENFEKIKRLDYLIVNPNQDGDGSYSLTQEVVQLRK
tara:strand:+ start:56 stop:598 length:543 start_codon:yes stop_codon:yes gene_type:complete